MDTKRLGNLGERVAESFLRRKDYEILDKNYSAAFISGPKRGEIDIVAKKGDIISFVEVKTLFSQGSFLPEDKVDFQKQRKIIKTAESWLTEKKISLDSPWQIDIIAVSISPYEEKIKIRHLENAIS